MREFIKGNTAIARAAINAGCNFFAGYPITPATSILLHMTRELPKVGGIAIQGEDEIASIGFCIGAALTGKRVMTATSGPGISLYSENIGAAIMVEVPMVIVDVQRMGPATGGPTLGSYGDVQFIRWGNSGGFPIIALAPTNVTECYNLTIKAFDLADRFRVPVFLLTDKETGLTKSTVDTDDFYDITDQKSDPLAFEETDSLKYSKNPGDIIPLSLYGGHNLVRLTTSSHTQEGYLTKNSEAILAHNQHLIAKIMNNLDQITMVNYDHQQDANTIIISYGITASAVKQAITLSRQEGNRVSSLTIHSLWPVPEVEIRNALSEVNRVVLPELNLGLYRREIERLVGDHQEIISLNRLDGGLISPIEILEVL